MAEAIILDSQASTFTHEFPENITILFFDAKIFMILKCNPQLSADQRLPRSPLSTIKGCRPSKT